MTCNDAMAKKALPRYENPEEVVGFYLHRNNFKAHSELEYWIVYKDGTVARLSLSFRIGKKDKSIPLVAGTLVESGCIDRGYPAGISLQEFIDGKRSYWSEMLCQQEDFRRRREYVRSVLAAAFKKIQASQPAAGKSRQSRQNKS